MPNYLPSIEERKKALLEDAAGACMAGVDGFQGSSPAPGPTAGYDPLMGFLKRRKKKRANRA